MCLCFQLYVFVCPEPMCPEALVPPEILAAETPEMPVTPTGNTNRPVCGRSLGALCSTAHAPAARSLTSA